jgi:hypothetical protein
MKYVFHIVLEKGGEGWRAVCPAFLQYGAITGGQTKDEAFHHLHFILLSILLDMERKARKIPGDKIVHNSIAMEIDTD